MLVVHLGLGTTAVSMYHAAEYPKLKHQAQAELDIPVAAQCDLPELRVDNVRRGPARFQLRMVKYIENSARNCAL
ncbi:MAG: hypothetical protein M3Y07_03770 [Acidobacteriota bacterium]|nr:hypothetical protein [Acidobacteriota bacterium]